MFKNIFVKMKIFVKKILYKRILMCYNVWA